MSDVKVCTWGILGIMGLYRDHIGYMGLIFIGIMEKGKLLFRV